MDDPNSGILQEIDGEYVVIRDGKFNSDPIKVEATTINTDPLEKITTTIYKYEGSGYLPPNFTLPEQTIRYEVSEDYTDFHNRSNNIPTNIRSIESTETKWTMHVEIYLQGSTDLFSKMAFHNIVLTIPVGLQGPDIAADGGIKVADFVLDSAHPFQALDVVITNVDIAKFKSSPDNKFVFTPGAIGDRGSLTMDGKIGIRSGEVIVETTSSSAAAPGSVTMVMAPSFSPIEVKTVTGDFYYSLDSFDVSVVDISGLPDFLTGGETDLALTNPQIYISINNPLAGYKLNPTSDLSIIPYRKNTPGEPATLNPGESITLPYTAGQGPYFFCMSPTTPDKMYPDYAGAKHVGFSALSDVFSGAGLPTSLQVDFKNAHVEGHVDKFELGKPLNTVSGNYTFYSPLNLKPGSKIVYSSHEDGWSDDTVEKLTITSLKVTTTVVNELPLDVEIWGYPTDTKGGQCIDPKTGKPVTITSVTVKANTTADIELNTEGTITDLNGIEYKATVVSVKSENLKPSGKLKLTKIRATANGYFTDKL